MKKLVEIEWVDHWGQTGWRDVNDVKCEGLLCKTVGYLVKQNRNGYLLAGTIDSSDMINSIQFRARKLVKRIRVLR